MNRYEVRLLVLTRLSAEALLSEVISDLEFDSQTETVVVSAAVLRRKASSEQEHDNDCQDHAER